MKMWQLFCSQDQHKDVRIHCKNKVVVGASKLVLACASEFLCSVFSTSCDCADARSATYDLVCPNFEPQAVEKVLELISGRGILISTSDRYLYTQVKMILDILKIAMDLPVTDLDDCFMDDIVDISVDGDNDGDDIDADSGLTDLGESIAEAEEESPENEAGVSRKASFDCTNCDDVFETAIALDRHTKVHIIPATPSSSSSSSGPSENLATTNNSETGEDSENTPLSSSRRSKTPKSRKRAQAPSTLFRTPIAPKRSRPSASRRKLPTPSSTNETATSSNETRSERPETESAAAAETKQETETASLNCDLCDKSFTLKFCLDQHRKKHLADSGKKVAAPVILKSVKTELPGNDFAAHQEAVEGHSEDAEDETLSGATSNEPNENPKDLQTKKSSSRRSKKKSSDSTFCQLCQVQLNSKWSYYSHLANEHYKEELRKLYNENQPENCTFCSKTFSNIEHLHCHLISNHGVLDRLVKNKENMAPDQEGLKSVAGEKSAGLREGHECNLCGVRVEKTTAYLKHLAMVHCKEQLKAMYGPGDNWQCGQCNLSFSNEDALVSHLLHTHKALKDLISYISNKELPEEDVLAAAEKPDQTDDAEPESGSSSRKKTFQCPTCGFMSCWYSNLRLHVATVHHKEKLLALVGESKLDCRLCHKFFRNQQNLFSHLIGVHNALEGILPPKKREGSESRKRPEKPAAEPSLQTNEDGVDPSVGPGNKPFFCFQCPTCQQHYSSYEHLLVHLASAHLRNDLKAAYLEGERTCDECNEALAVKNDDKLLEHLALHHDQLVGNLPRREALLISVPDAQNEESEGKGRFECRHCGRLLQQKRTLAMHQRCCPRLRTMPEHDRDETEPQKEGQNKKRMTL